MVGRIDERFAGRGNAVKGKLPKMSASGNLSLGAAAVDGDTAVKGIVLGEQPS